MKTTYVNLIALLFFCSCSPRDLSSPDVQSFYKYTSVVEAVFDDFGSGLYPEEHDQIVYDLFLTLEPGKPYPAEIFIQRLDPNLSRPEIQRVTNTPWGKMHFEFLRQMGNSGSEVIYHVKLLACDELQGIDYVIRRIHTIRFGKNTKNHKWIIHRDISDVYYHKEMRAKEMGVSRQEKHNQRK